MVQLCDQGPNPDCVKLLESETDNWVLVSLAFEGDVLRGFSFFTLDRIGGTPGIVIGLSSVACYSKRKTVMRGLVIEQFKRALISFPEEDVIVGTRVDDASTYDIFWQLHDIIPRPNYDPNGEDRAWGKRLAKRFGIENSSYDPKEFKVAGKGGPAPVWCYNASDKSDARKTGGVGCKMSLAELKRIFKKIDPDQGDSLIVHGWVHKEDLTKFHS